MFYKQPDSSVYTVLRAWRVQSGEGFQRDSFLPQCSVVLDTDKDVTSCHRGAATGSPAASSHPIFRPLQDHAQGMLNRVEVAVGYEGWKLRILVQVQHLHVWLCSLSSSA